MSMSGAGAPKDDFLSSLSASKAAFESGILAFVATYAGVCGVTMRRWVAAAYIEVRVRMLGAWMHDRSRAHVESASS